MMTSEKFLQICENEVAEYFNRHADVTDGVSIKPIDVYVVWYCKTLQNHKALLSTPMECTTSVRTTAARTNSISMRIRSLRIDASVVELSRGCYS